MTSRFTQSFLGYEGCHGQEIDMTDGEGGGGQERGAMRRATEWLLWVLLASWAANDWNMPGSIPETVNKPSGHGISDEQQTCEASTCRRVVTNSLRGPYHRYVMLPSCVLLKLSCYIQKLYSSWFNMTRCMYVSRMILPLESSMYF